MARRKPNHNFKIHVDDSSSSTPTDEKLEEDSTMSKNREVSEASAGDDKVDIREGKEGIVESIEGHDNEEDQGDDSILSTNTDDYQDDGAEIGHHTDSNARRSAVDEGGDSSSQHETTDEDVFSDNSPRSSLGGSYDGRSESGKTVDNAEDNETVVTRTPRVSDISQYEKEDFVLTARGTPRPPFRTPSDVRAMQMSSPPPSVFGSVIDSPRSGKRPFPTVSRLGSPSGSTQYSPKNRTPSRFKSKTDAPLVLLHATLLPLRWAWSSLINSVDSSEMSEEVKTLRDSWRVLQDRMGDTVVERGILLGHPQNDYEVLEERLLEALELPMRRRARILECGHYLGPANEYGLNEDTDSEDDYSDTGRPSAKKHWCNTCKHDIRYGDLGPGKIFRVKVYASNGLMRAGAWAACWKEMERIDVEVVPIVEPSVHEELVRLAAAHQEREMAQQQHQSDIASEIIQQIEEQQRGRSSPEQPDLFHAHVEVPPARSARSAHSSVSRRSRGEDRRRRDEEERLREMYGRATPEPHHEEHHEQHHRKHDEPRLESHYQPHQAQRSSSRLSSRPNTSSAREPRPDSYMPPRPPSSHPPPPEETASERREFRPPPPQSDSLPELLFRSVQVLMQDRKNVAIFTLSVFVLLLALRSASQQPRFDPGAFDYMNIPQVQNHAVTEAPPSVIVQDEVPQMQYQAMSEAPRAVEEKQTPQSPEISSEVVQHDQAPSIESIMSYATTSTVPSAASQQTVAVEESVVPIANSAGEASVEASSVAAAQPCETPVAAHGEQGAETVREKKVVRVVETVTETETFRVKVTATATETIAPEPTVDLEENVELPTEDEVKAPVVEDVMVDTEAPVAEDIEIPAVECIKAPVVDNHDMPVSPEEEHVEAATAFEMDAE